MSYFFSKPVQSYFLLLFLVACGIKKESPKDRTYIPDLEENAHIEEMPDYELLMRNLPNDALRGYGACRWLNKVSSTGGTGRFRVTQNVAIADHRRFWEFWKRPLTYSDLFNKDHSIDYGKLTARTDIGANPLYQFALAYFSEENIPNSQEFFKLFDKRMFESRLLFPGFLAIRALLTFGIIDSVEQRNKAIKKGINEIFPGSFQSTKESLLKESLVKPLLRNGTPRLTQLSPLAESTLTLAQKEQKFWRVMGRYGQATPLFSSGNWRSFNEEMRTALSVAIDSWSSKDPEEQACASILFQRAEAQLLTLMGHDRPGFIENSDQKTSYLFDVEDLLVARDATNFRVCPTAGSFVKEGRRTFITLNDFARTGSGQKISIGITTAPYVAPPCSEPIARSRPEYVHYRGERMNSEKIGRGNDLIDFFSAASQFAIALNPGAPWWKNKTYPLLNFTSMDSLENSNGIMPSLSYALSLGLLYIGLEKVLDHHLVMVDFNNRRTPTEDNALGVRISHEPIDQDGPQNIATDAQAAFRLSEISFKMAEMIDGLAVWNSKQLRETRNNRRAREQYKETITGLFGSQKNLDALLSRDSMGPRARLKKLQLATAMLLTRFAKKQPDGFYTCHTKLKTNLETGEESAEGNCATDSPYSHKLFKEMAKIMAKRYSSPIFADFAKEAK